MIGDIKRQVREQSESLSKAPVPVNVTIAVSGDIGRLLAVRNEPSDTTKPVSKDIPEPRGRSLWERMNADDRKAFVKAALVNISETIVYGIGTMSSGDKNGEMPQNAMVALYSARGMTELSKSNEAIDKVVEKMNRNMSLDSSPFDVLVQSTLETMSEIEATPLGKTLALPNH